MKRRSTAGFTLLEVVIALAILAVSLVMLLTTNASNIENASQSRDITIATMLARSKMIDVEQHLFDKGFTTGEESESGSFDEEGYPDIQWKWTTTEVDMDLSGLGGLCEGFSGGQGENGAEGAEGGGCGDLLASFGGGGEGLLGEIANSVRLVRLELTWPDGPKYKQTMKFTALATREDMQLEAVPGLPPGVSGLPGMGGLPPGGGGSLLPPPTGKK